MLSYEVIFSRFRGLVHDPRELSLDINDLNEIYIERLHQTFANPRLRKKLNKLVLHDDVMLVEYELRNSIDEFSDNEYIANLVSMGMVIMWLRPQIDSIKNTAAFIGGKEEKRLLDNHSDMMDRLHTLEVQFDSALRDRGYLFNSYIEE